MDDWTDVIVGCVETLWNDGQYWDGLNNWFCWDERGWVDEVFGCSVGCVIVLCVVLSPNDLCLFPSR